MEPLRFSTKHTTTGVTVNEALECLESDIVKFPGTINTRRLSV